MTALATVQYLILWALCLAVLAMQVFAFVDAARHRAEAYTATSNQTKQIWLLITGVSVGIGLIALPNFIGPLTMSLFYLIAIVASGIYLTRVRPAVRAITGGGSSSSGW